MSTKNTPPSPPSSASAYVLMVIGLTVLIVVISSVLLVGSGIYIMKHREFMHKIDGTVIKDADCTTTSNINWCTIDVGYTINDKTYKKRFSTPTHHFEGDKVIVWYNPKRPELAELYVPTKHVGWGLIGIAIFILVISIIWFWIFIKLFAPKFMV